MTHPNEVLYKEACLVFSNLCDVVLHELDTKSVLMENPDLMAQVSDFTQKCVVASKANEAANDFNKELDKKAQELYYAEIGSDKHKLGWNEQPMSIKNIFVQRALKQ